VSARVNYQNGNAFTDAPDYRPKDAVAALIKRLAHRNANVQLYTLEVGSY
jgi:hypothetical protein